MVLGLTAFIGTRFMGFENVACMASCCCCCLTPKGLVQLTTCCCCCLTPKPCSGRSQPGHQRWLHRQIHRLHCRPQPDPRQRSPDSCRKRSRVVCCGQVRSRGISQDSPQVEIGHRSSLCPTSTEPAEMVAVAAASCCGRSRSGKLGGQV